MLMLIPRLLYALLTPVLFVPLLFLSPPFAILCWASTGREAFSGHPRLLRMWLDLGDRMTTAAEPEPRIVYPPYRH